MLRIADIEMRLMQCDPAIFQTICNEILYKEGYKPFKFTGSLPGTNKTKLGTPDSVFIDSDQRYVYVEITTQQKGLESKIIKDVEKCIKKIKKNSILENKISKILFIHNQENPDEIIIEEIKKICGNIEFEIYGLAYLALELQNNYKDLAMSLLDIRDDVQMINSFTEESIDKLAEAVVKKSASKYKDDAVEKIKKKIEELYTAASDIINNEDAVINITRENKLRLKSIFDNLKSFDFYYNNEKETKDALNYFYNLFVIISKYDYCEGIKFYDELPQCIKENVNTRHFYTMLLIANQEYDKAEKICEDLYFNLKYDEILETLMKVYFFQEKYEQIVEMLSKCNEEKFDKRGFLASIFVIARNFLMKFSEKEIIELNETFFKNMPLYYSSTASLMYDLKLGNKSFKRQFLKGISCIIENDVVVIDIMCKEAVKLGLQNEMIAFLEKIESMTPVVKECYMNLFMYKDTIDLRYIEKIENILKDPLIERIDKNLMYAKIAESKGKELEAIKLYKDSFIIKGNNYSGIKYVQLSLKNESVIEEKILNELVNGLDFNFPNIIMDAYEYIGKGELAIEYLYKALYKNRRLKNEKKLLKLMWYNTINCKFESNIDIVLKDCVVVLSRGRTVKKYLIEDEEFFEEKEVFLDLTITKSYGEIGIKLLGLKKDEVIIIDDKKYKVLEILNKYTYLKQESFKCMENDKHVEVFYSDKQDVKGVLEEITKKMSQVNKECDEMLDIYQNNDNIPLSGLLNNKNDFEDYAKLLNTLLTDENRVLLSGEMSNVEIKDGFVIDISAIIVMTLLEELDNIPVDFLKKIYITMSLKNKFRFFYDTLLKNQGEMMRRIYLPKDNKLVLNETAVIEQIKFWKKLNDYINNFTVIEIEAEKDELLTERTIGFLDKTQIDLIKLAQYKKVPFISDDLMLRKIAGFYGVKHTNSIKLINCWRDNQKDYINKLIKYAECNYIYTLCPEILQELLMELYEDFNDNSKETFLKIVESVLKNKISLQYYVPILTYVLENIKSIQYVKIMGVVYQNLCVSFLLNEVAELIEKKCEEHKFNIKTMKYE